MKNLNKVIFAVGLLLVPLCGCAKLTKDNSSSDDQPKEINDFPSVSGDGKTLTYGYYPQSRAFDSNIVAGLDALSGPTANGWYYYKGDYYVKYNATPYASYYKFDDGTTIESGVSYWFKCEPIVWKILSSKSGQYYVASEKALDATMFYSSTIGRSIGGKTVYPSNYEHSDIRTWLNDNFFNSAFKFNNSYVQLTNVDNSASTTNSNSNPYTCNNTSDKVFLPSYKDYANHDYGFNYDYQRATITSDFARARGAMLNTYSVSFKNYSVNWTRSPYSENPLYVYYTNSDGGFLVSEVNKSYYGVRPAINVRIA